VSILEETHLKEKMHSEPVKNILLGVFPTKRLAFFLLPLLVI